MEEVLDYLRREAGIGALAIVFAAAALEYLLPFLPGDSVVLAASLLVVAGAWPFWVVALTAITGGVVGALSHYAIGRLLIDERGGLRGGRYIEKLLGQGRLDKFFELFRKHGMWVIALNRAFPGVRSVTFIAAGAARLSLVKTMLFGLVSNVAWSVVVLGAGVSVGGNWQKIKDALGVYQSVVGVGLLVVLAVVFLIRRRRKSRV